MTVRRYVGFTSAVIVVGETATGRAEIKNDVVRLPEASTLRELARTVAQLLTGTQPVHLAAS